MATNLFRGSCTPNLGGVQDYYTKAEINQLFRRQGGPDTTFLETGHVWVGNPTNVQSKYQLDPNYYTIDHSAGTVVNLSADRLRTARTLSLTGVVTGTVSSNLATGFTINTTVTPGMITGAMIGTGAITDTNISLTAEIAVSKLADGNPRQLLQTDAAGTGVEWADNIDVPGTLDVTGNAVFDANVNIAGNLTVSGTQTILDVETLQVEDRNIELGKVATPTDITADGGGITLLGDTGKTIIWERSTASWSLSEHLNIPTSRSYRINNIPVLSATALGASVQITTDNIPPGTVTNEDLAGGIVDTKLNTITTANKVSISALDIDGGTDIGAALADTDLFVVDDGGAGTNRKAVATRITDYTFGKVSGDITISSGGTAAIAAGVIVDGDINASAAIAHSKLATMAAGQVLLGNASNVPTSTSVTGDVTINNTGVTAITSGVIVDGDINASAGIVDTKLATIATAGKVSNSATTATSANTASAIVARDASGNFTAGTITATITGNADTATKLSSQRTFALSGNVTGTVNSDLETGFTISTAIASGVVTSDMIANGTIVDADINASAGIVDTKLATIATAGKVSNSATTATSANTVNTIVARDGSGNFTAGTITAALTGNADTATKLSSQRTFAVTGDITGTVNSDLTSGASIATSIAAGVIVDGDINASASIAFSKLAALTSANILVGSSGNVATSVSVTGDVTIGNTGVTAITAGVIVDADISATAEIAVSKLADGAARQLLQTDSAGTGVEWTSNIDVPGTLDVTGNAVFDSRVTINGTDITESARDIEESRLIRRNATLSIGTPGTVPFGVGPVVPPGMSLVGIGADAYNVIDIYSGSVC